MPDTASPTLTSIATPPRGLHEHAGSALALTEHCLDLLLSRSKRLSAPAPPALHSQAQDFLGRHVGGKKRRRLGVDTGAAPSVSGDLFMATGVRSASRFIADDSSSHLSNTMPAAGMPRPTSHFATLDMHTLHGPSPTHGAHQLRSSGGGGHYAHPPGFHHAPPHAHNYPTGVNGGHYHAGGGQVYHNGAPARHPVGIVDPLASFGANVAPPVSLPNSQPPHAAGFGPTPAGSHGSRMHMHAPPSFGYQAASVPTQRHSVVSSSSKVGHEAASDSGHSSDSSSLASVRTGVQQDGILQSLAHAPPSNLLPSGDDRGHSTSPHGHYPKPPSRPQSTSFGQDGLLAGVAGDTAPHNVVLRPKASGTAGGAPTPTLAGMPVSRVDASPALLPTPEPPQPVPAGMPRGNQESTREALMAEVADLFAHLPPSMRSLPLSHMAAQGWRRRPRHAVAGDAAAMKSAGVALSSRTPKSRGELDAAAADNASAKSVPAQAYLTADSAPRRAASEADAAELSSALSEAFCRARGQHSAPAGLSKLELGGGGSSSAQARKMLSPTLLLLHSMAASQQGVAEAHRRSKVGANPSATTRDLRRSDAAQQWAAARAAAAMANGGAGRSGAGLHGQQGQQGHAAPGAGAGQSALQLLSGANLFPGAEALTAEVGVKLQAIAAAQGTAAQSIAGGSALLGNGGDRGSAKRAPASVTFGRLADGSTFSGSRV